MGAKTEIKGGSDSLVSDHYSVKTICQLTGLNEHTLRAWERRYQVVNPHRMNNGRRVYSLDDLEKLKLVTLLVRKGFLIGNIAGSDIENLSSLVNDAQAISSDTQEADGRALGYIHNLKRYIFQYDLLSIHAKVQQARTELGVKAFLFDVVIPLKAELNEMVFEGTCKLGQKQAFSAIIRSELMQLLYLFSSTHSHPARERQEAAKIFAIGTNEENPHEVGALIAAVICASHGFPVYYFGASMPADSFLEAAKAVGANCILLGLPTVTMMPPSTIDNYMRSLKSELPSICQLWALGQVTDAMATDKSIRKLPSLIELDHLLASIRAI